MNQYFVTVRDNGKFNIEPYKANNFNSRILISETLIEKKELKNLIVNIIKKLPEIKEFILIVNLKDNEINTITPNTRKIYNKDKQNSINNKNITYEDYETNILKDISKRIKNYDKYYYELETLLEKETYSFNFNPLTILNYINVVKVQNGLSYWNFIKSANIEQSQLTDFEINAKIYMQLFVCYTCQLENTWSNPKIDEIKELQEVMSEAEQFLFGHLPNGAKRIKLIREDFMVNPISHFMNKK